MPYARKLPGARKYRVCLVKGSTTHEGREPWDGTGSPNWGSTAVAQVHSSTGTLVGDARRSENPPSRPDQVIQ